MLDWSRALGHTILSAIGPSQPSIQCKIPTPVFRQTVFIDFINVSVRLWCQTPRTEPRPPTLFHPDIKITDFCQHPIMKFSRRTFRVFFFCKDCIQQSYCRESDCFGLTWVSSVQRGHSSRHMEKQALYHMPGLLSLAEQGQTPCHGRARALKYTCYHMMSCTKAKSLITPVKSGQQLGSQADQV